MNDLYRSLRFIVLQPRPTPVTHPRILDARDVTARRNALVLMTRHPKMETAEDGDRFFVVDPVSAIDSFPHPATQSSVAVTVVSAEIAPRYSSETKLG